MVRMLLRIFQTHMPREYSTLQISQRVKRIWHDLLSVLSMKVYICQLEFTQRYCLLGGGGGGGFLPYNLFNLHFKLSY